MIVDQLRAIVGEAHALTGDAIEPRYLTDAAGGRSGKPALLVRPADTAQLADVVANCARAGRAIAIQGGRTGMCHGATPQDDEIILSLERLNRIEGIDAKAGTMIVGAGVILQSAQEAAAEAGWRLAVDIGARGSCTIGGMIATNAGGHQVMRQGMMRDQVLGLEVVLADGTVLSSMNQMLKNNAGYDLKHLFIGSEGTLGIVTRAVLRLRPPAIGRQTALCGLLDYDAVIAMLNRVGRALPGQVSAFELMWRDFFEAAGAIAAGGMPFAVSYDYQILIEVEAADDAPFVGILSELLDAGIVADAIIAQSDREVAQLWSLRDAIGPLVGSMTIVEPFDVSAPIARIGPLVTHLRAALLDAIPRCRPYFFGHIADGNLHLALDLPTDADRTVAEALVYNAVRDAAGSVSAEHGIGLLKRGWLGHSRTVEEIALMRTLRRTMDPAGVLNPGRVVETLTPGR
ncbi:FAD-binding oxidoreductase [Sphingomonas sp.]|uniref:FAD-binding oxidoreductase n=1 Tax=Sphingomonas sp. TaxID=28214 RepID=UPI000DB3AECA|nr:FAD-binding oxidoreductase [Sphingomonas sp.]PZU10764.1 MAG: FAD-binding oxidoreductase [Sphingomonas sp.]